MNDQSKLVASLETKLRERDETIRQHKLVDREVEVLRQQKQWLTGKNKDLEGKNKDLEGELERSKNKEEVVTDSSHTNTRNKDTPANDSSAKRKAIVPQSRAPLSTKENDSAKSNPKAPVPSGQSAVSTDLRNLLLGSGKRGSRRPT